MDKEARDNVKSFLFGIKFVVLISFLFIPIFLGFVVVTGGFTFFQKVPSLYRQKLEILSIRSFPLAQGEIGHKLTTNKEYSLYARTNRRALDDYEREKLSNLAEELLSDQKTLKAEVVNPDNGARKGEIYTSESYSLKTVFSPGLTVLGHVLYAVFIIVGIFLCFALYFPLFRALFNLFKDKKAL